MYFLFHHLDYAFAVYGVVGVGGLETIVVGASGCIAGVPTVGGRLDVEDSVNEDSPAVVYGEFVVQPAAVVYSHDREQVVYTIAVGGYEIREYQQLVAI